MMTSRVVGTPPGYAPPTLTPVPELRHDTLTGRLVLLAPGRSARPHTTTDPTSRPSGSVEGCPFCADHERETPPEVLRTGHGPADGVGWRVRVVPNLYPIVGGPDAGRGATGAHEVIVLSPDHHAAFGSLDDDQAVEVLTVMRDRARAHAEAGRAHVQLLVNQGRAAGASIAHPHAQLLALDFVPPTVSVATDRFAALGSDLVLGDNVDAVERGGAVVTGDEVRAWCPTGSRAPFEVRIAAMASGTNFEAATDGQVLGTALVLRDVLAALARALDDPPYNVVVHTAAARPTVTDATPFHWWVEVVPRVSAVAGFELGTGVLVNTVAPEHAAERLRELL
jgi:UDPglucose--hexose-1-phosphate uridylyltransferase